MGYTEVSLEKLVIDFQYQFYKNNQDFSGQEFNRPFYSCLLGDLAFEWERG